MQNNGVVNYLFPPKDMLIPNISECDLVWT